MGSSPLTRGKPRSPRQAWGGHRLIPAHAGKTPGSDLCQVKHAAHPRSRGENTADDALTQQPAGSSPLTRGKHGEVGVGAGGLGLIPAHAGKTRS